MNTKADALLGRLHQPARRSLNGEFLSVRRVRRTPPRIRGHPCRLVVFSGVVALPPRSYGRSPGGGCVARAGERGYRGRQDAALTGRLEACRHQPPPWRRLCAFGGLLSALLTFPAGAAEDRLPALASTASALTNPPLRQVGPGIFELGKVRLDQTRRTVSFPAVLNMDAGLIEYLVVTESGKTHESLVRTEVAPHQIHLAMLLLGARGTGTNAFPENHAVPLPGDPVRIELVWKLGGKEQRLAAEATLRNRETHAAVSPGAWTYTGSRVIEGIFLAQEVGSIVSLIEDPDALINNPRSGRENDELWEIRPRGLPPLDAPLEVILKLESRPATPKSKSGRSR